MKFAGQTSGFLENTLAFFAGGISPDPQQDPKEFNRKRKLPFERLVVFILHIVSGDTKGIDIKSGLFFKMARQCGVWTGARPATRSAVTKARKKLHWRVFENAFSSVVSLALRHWPSDTFRSKRPAAARRELSPLTVRVVRVILPNGEPALYLTDLLDSATFSREEIADLYRRRWEVEIHHRDEKVHLDIETFHARSVNGVHQELRAVAIMAVIARTLMALSMELASGEEEPAAGEEELDAATHESPTQSRRTKPEPQFEHAIMALGQAVAMLVADDPWRALERFTELLEQIGRVQYHRPKNPRPSAPRVTKRNINKWIKGRADRMNAA